MYFPKTVIALSFMCVVGLNAANAQIVTVFNDSFDSYADGNADAVYLAAYTASANYTISSTNGLGGTKSLQNAADSTIIRKDSSIDFTAGGGSAFVTVGLYFQYADSGGLAGPQIGLVGAGNGSFVTSADISGRLNANKLQLRSNNGTVATAATAVSFVTGNWYKLEYSVERTSTTNEFNVSLVVYNSSSSGVQGSMLDSIGATFANANMWGDSSIFAGIRENTSILNLDDFGAFQGVASNIPEPSTTALIAGASLLGFLLSRRRRLTK